MIDFFAAVGFGRDMSLLFCIQHFVNVLAAAA
jgi:hypothetical protein